MPTLVRPSSCGQARRQSGSDSVTAHGAEPAIVRAIAPDEESLSGDDREVSADRPRRVMAAPSPITLVVAVVVRISVDELANDLQEISATVTRGSDLVAGEHEDGD
jgi:hypothetical protein